jgi:hypothetical protein
MPNYANAKIYQVISPNHPLPYIGSTTQPLCKRMTQHRRSNECRSRIIIEAGDAYIELIEEFSCENKEQLNKREGEIIRERECVNHNIAGRTDREYYIDNHEKLKGQCLAYYHQNKAEVKEHVKRMVQCPTCQKTLKYCSLVLHRKNHCKAKASPTSIPPPCV